MARPLRLEFPGALYHVMSRGNRRETIYVSPADFQVFLDVLGDACERFNWVCHAYCLMTNHYHLLIETPEGNLSRGMRHLNGVYSQAFNRSNDKVGHVFQGRHKAIVVQKETYLLELARYIVLNPLRAKMVAQLGDWPWSSYHAMLGSTEPPAWLAVNNLLRQFAPTFRRARAAYVAFVADGVDLPSPMAAAKHQLVLGDQAFREKFELDRAIDREIVRSHRRAVSKPLGTLCLVWQRP